MASNSLKARCNSSSAAITACIPSSCQIGGGSYLGDGIQADGSFHQHGAVIADGSYGPAFTGSILTFLPWVAGLSEWEPTSANLAALGTLVMGQRRMALPGGASASTFAPPSHAGGAASVGGGRAARSFELSATPARFNRPVWDYQVCGRGCVINPGIPGVSIPTAQLRFAATLYPNTSEVAAEFLAFAAELDGMPVPSPPSPLPPSPPAPNVTLAGKSFGYFRSDYVLHRRAGWSASWKGRSNRTIPARCVNDDSKMSADTGEGSTFVYRSDEGGNAHAGIWPVINWQQFPGVTVLQGTLQPCNWSYTYTDYPTFVGVASNGRYTMASQTIGSHGLTARRSWLFSDDAVISLASNLKVDPLNVVGDDHSDASNNDTNKRSGIRSSSNGGVQTTLANQRLAGNVMLTFTNGTKLQLQSEGNHTFAASDLQSVWHNHTSYIFTTTSAAAAAPATAATVEIENGKRYGDYYRISTNHKPASDLVFRISYRHDSGGLSNPETNSMASSMAPLGYAVLPNTNTIPSVASATTTTTTGDNTHTVADLNAGVVALTFWKSSSVRVGGLITVTTSEPCLVLLQSDILSPSMHPNEPGQMRIEHQQPEKLSISVSNPNQPNGIVVVMTITMQSSLPAKSVAGKGCALSRSGSSAEIKVTLLGGEYMGKTSTCILQY